MKSTPGTAAVFRGRECAKIGLRRSLYRFNLDLVRDPFPRRVVTTLAWLRVDTVLDVGANVGQYASALRANGFAGRIVSCEPMSAEHAVLARRAARDPRWTSVQAAVGAVTGEIDINVSANSYSSSLLPMSRAHVAAVPNSSQVRTERVRLTTIPILVAEEVIDPSRTLLKVDTQGYEAEVLNGAGQMASEFPAIQLELSYACLYEGQPTAEELTARLHDAGYGLHAFEPGIADPRTGRTLQADGLFIRTR